MFRQEPRLPVDFLLGRVPDPGGGDIHEWIQEHQVRLQAAFQGAQERLKVAAERRKRNYDRHLRDAPLTEGQLVRLRDLSTRGCHKIQDKWGPMVYRVLRAPTGGGSVYTIAPVDDPTKARQVNRTLLKAVVGADPKGGAPAPCSPPTDSPQSEDERLCGGDLFLRGHESSQETPPRTATVTQTTPLLLLPQADPIPVRAADLPSTVPATPLRRLPDTSEAAVRRTAGRLLGNTLTSITSQDQ